MIRLGRALSSDLDEAIEKREKILALDGAHLLPEASFRSFLLVTLGLAPAACALPSSASAASAPRRRRLNFGSQSLPYASSASGLLIAS